MKNYNDQEELAKALEPAMNALDYANIRWADEKEYEDRQEYVNHLKEVCNKAGVEYVSCTETFKRMDVKATLTNIVFTLRISLTATGITLKHVK